MNNIKIKYLIGSFRDDPNYPTEEDFYFLINNWFYTEGGKDLMTISYKSDFDGIVFTNTVLTDKLNGDKELANKLIEILLSKEKIKHIKGGKATHYYLLL